MKARPHDTPQHSVSVAGVILDATASHVLLIQRRDNGRWEPPGGVLELDETIEDGLRREIKEETGIDITVDTLTGVYKNVCRGIVALTILNPRGGGSGLDSGDRRPWPYGVRLFRKGPRRDHERESERPRSRRRSTRSEGPANLTSEPR